ncbi:MAG: cell division transport system permease protein [Chloroflexota bacterium]|jgi:cell division transport system permease protein|nr:cell division transport system permease protein [Chloroflexota bacterium]MEA2548210.1 cell division transport system permease protein [Chloroflexota bacterium]
MIGFVVFSLRRAWQGFWRNALMSLAATATMVLMLVLLAGFWIIQTGLLSALDFTESKVEVVANVKIEATPNAIADLNVRIKAMPNVAGVTFVSRADALTRFQQSMANQGREDLSKYLDTNPFPASFEVKLTDPGKAAVVADALRQEPAVRNVLDTKETAQNVKTVTDILRTAGSVILLVIGVIVLFIIVNTIRLAVVARSEEIEIMRLVGASDAFIRWPFVFEGAMVGLFGAAITLVALYLLADPIGSFMVDFFRVLPLSFGSLARDLVVLVTAAGLGLGVLGSWLSVRTYLIK